MTLPVAELPDSGYIIFACVIVAIAALVGIGAILRGLQGIRSGLAEELKREIDSAKQPAPVQVQSPLVVKAHESLVSRAEHEALAEKLDKELGRERSSRKGLYEKTEDLGNRLTRVEEKTDSQTLKLNTMDQKMDQVLMRLPRTS